MDPAVPMTDSLAYVECPYCDGENIVSDHQSSRSEGKFPDREIACQHCQCLFLLSESREGICLRPIKKP